MRKTLSFLLLPLFATQLYAANCFQEAPAEDIYSWNDQLSTVVNSYISTYKIPGAVILVGNANGILFEKAYGKRSQVETDVNSIDTIYDLASITKLFTATAIMQLAEKEKLYVGSKVKRFFPDYFVSPKKQILSIEDLLRHNSGFKAGLSSSVFTDNIESTWDNILQVEPTFPYRQFKYSDINYLMLGKLIEEMTNSDLNTYIRKNILEPTNMNSSMFLAYQDSRCDKLCAPTRRNLKKGHVHDPTSFKLEEVTGHAGLFTTAKDLAKFASLFMNDGKYCGKKILSEKSVKLMTTRKNKEIRGLGFDILSPYSVKPRGDYFAKGLSYGHTGFTGTSLWIDPTIDTFLIVLTNTVYATDEKFAKSGYLKMITELANIVGEANAIK